MKFIIITINIIIIFWVKASLSDLRFSFLLPTFTLTAPDLCIGVSPVKRLTDLSFGLQKQKVKLSKSNLAPRAEIMCRPV